MPSHRGHLKNKELKKKPQTGHRNWEVEWQKIRAFLKTNRLSAYSWGHKESSLTMVQPGQWYFSISEFQWLYPGRDNKYYSRHSHTGIGKTPELAFWDWWEKNVKSGNILHAGEKAIKVEPGATRFSSPKVIRKSFKTFRYNGDKWVWSQPIEQDCD